jgi:hypothetical protein
MSFSHGSSRSMPQKLARAAGSEEFHRTRSRDFIAACLSGFLARLFGSPGFVPSNMALWFGLLFHLHLSLVVSMLGFPVLSA